MKKTVLSITALLSLLLLTGCFGGPKLVCKSDEGNITLHYNDSTIIGYTVVGMTYDLDEQQEYAEAVGVDTYIEEFINWFESNTTGTCTIEEEE